MKSKLVFPTFLFVAILAVALIAFAYKKPGEIILYYSTECPHCKNVEDFIQQNQVQNKISFTQKEISDPANLKDLQSKAKQCNLQSDTVGIPFLWYNGKCILGDTDIINFFKSKL